MKKLPEITFCIFFVTFCFFFPGCVFSAPAQVAATTLPVYEFTTALCQGTDITVTRLVTEEVSCLHDYSLNVRQIKAAEAADLIVLSGAGLEEFMEDILEGKPAIDASQGISLLCPEEEHHHDHEEEGHHHEQDPHIWLSPENAKLMARNICDGLSARYPAHAETLQNNLTALLNRLSALQTYGDAQLQNLTSRDIISFHDGFAYFAESFDLTILEAVEEESGREASAKELIHLIEIVQKNQLPSIFTEQNGSVSAAEIISRETGAGCFALDMAMSGDSYFDAMYHNIDTIKEALT